MLNNIVLTMVQHCTTVQQVGVVYINVCLSLTAVVSYSANNTGHVRKWPDTLRDASENARES